MIERNLEREARASSEGIWAMYSSTVHGFLDSSGAELTG